MQIETLEHESFQNTYIHISGLKKNIQLQIKKLIIKNNKNQIQFYVCHPYILCKSERTDILAPISL